MDCRNKGILPRMMALSIESEDFNEDLHRHNRPLWQQICNFVQETDKYWSTFFAEYISSMTRRQRYGLDPCLPFNEDIGSIQTSSMVDINNNSNPPSNTVSSNTQTTQTVPLDIINPIPPTPSSLTSLPSTSTLSFDPSKQKQTLNNTQETMNLDESGSDTSSQDPSEDLPRPDSLEILESSPLSCSTSMKLQQFVTLNNWYKSIGAQLYKILIERSTIRKSKNQSHFGAIRSIFFQHNQLVPVLILPDRAKHQRLISVFFESEQHALQALKINFNTPEFFRYANQNLLNNKTPPIRIKKSKSLYF